MIRTLALALLLPTLLTAQGRRFDDATWLGLERLETPVPSPDGKWIAFTRVRADTAASRFRSSVWVMEDDGRALRELSLGRLPDWSPDGNRLAVLHEGAVWVITRDGTAPPVQVTPDALAVEQLRWSPDGMRLAVAARPAAPTLGGATIVIAAGGHPGANRSVHLVTLDGQAPRMITPEGFEVGLPDPGLPDVREFDWLDDATVVVAGRAAGEGRLGETAMVVFDTLGIALRTLPLGEGVWHAPVVSPDRKQVAFTGHPWSEAGWTAEELWVMQPNGAALRRLTPNLDRAVADVAWAGDNKTLWFTVEERGSRNVHRTSIKGDGLKPGISGVHALALGGVATRGNFGVVVRQRPDAPPALWRFPTGKPWELKPLFAPNDSVMQGVVTGEVEEFEYRAADGTPIHAWLFRPPGYDPARRYPLVVEIHGGPHAMAGAGFSPSRLRRTAEGWLVLAVNPRGSTGFGGDFANAVARAWPGIDADDILAGVDDVLARGLADSTRIALVGLGGGGVAVGAILTRGPRFAAGILRCTGTGWVALSDGPDRAPWGEWTAAKPLRILPELWMDRSPIHRVSGVRTPTLTITGTRTAPGAADFAEAFHLGVGRTGTAATFARLNDGCGVTATSPHTALAVHAAESAWLEQYAPERR